MLHPGEVAAEDLWDREAHGGGLDEQLRDLDPIETVAAVAHRDAQVPGADGSQRPDLLARQLTPGLAVSGAVSGFCDRSGEAGPGGGEEEPSSEPGLVAEARDRA